MTAADAREELEAVIHRQLTRAWRYGLEPNAPRPRPVDVILAAHDAAVAAAVAEALDGRDREQRVSAAYERLAAEIMRGTP